MTVGLHFSLLLEITKKRRREVILGDAEDDSCDFKAVVLKEWSWFHVSRLPLDVDEGRMRGYIMGRFGLEDCVCSLIRPKYAGRSTFHSFKVGVESSESEHFLLPTKWPKGVAVSPWYFHPPGRKGAPK